MRFQVRDFVLYHDGRDVAHILDAKHCESRGWTYFINDVTVPDDIKEPFVINGDGSGWWREECFQPITEPVLVLRAELTKQMEIRSEMLRNANVADQRIRELEHSLELIERATS